MFNSKPTARRGSFWKFLKCILWNSLEYRTNPLFRETSFLVFCTFSSNRLVRDERHKQDNSCQGELFYCYEFWVLATQTSILWLPWYCYPYKGSTVNTGSVHLRCRINSGQKSRNETPAWNPGEDGNQNVPLTEIDLPPGFDHRLLDCESTRLELVVSWVALESSIATETSSLKPSSIAIKLCTRNRFQM